LLCELIFIKEVNELIDYLIEMSDKTKIPVLDLVKISESVKYFTKDEQIIKEYMTNNYKGLIYEENNGTNKIYRKR